LEPPLQKRFDILTAIHRASYFQWLTTAGHLCPEVSQPELVASYWEEVGHDTARNYLKHIDRRVSLPGEIARNVVFSSICMGEDAVLINGEGDEAWVEHRGCPWFDWHVRMDRLDQDLLGCDKWIETLVEDINHELQGSVCWETIESLPQGDGICLRRFWSA
jgi:hypothetical protein